ncbi:hypothetical protein DPMN_129094 [Dreissena polymorpha]|uniref:Uncharacterized protein n=1 Tax=Dreissena polymorpha TaxID=45954 RepID=A0A9D4JWB5_DREPO|nr:hypothetical protein DPMN_129094 [Dreissena polymorpha]
MRRACLSTKSSEIGNGRTDRTPSTSMSPQSLECCLKRCCRRFTSSRCLAARCGSRTSTITTPAASCSYRFFPSPPPSTRRGRCNVHYGTPFSLQPLLLLSGITTSSWRSVPRTLCPAISSRSPRVAALCNATPC